MNPLPLAHRPKRLFSTPIGALLRIQRGMAGTALALAALLPLGAQAQSAASSPTVTLRWAAQNDILTLDPHSQNHSTTSAILMHAYEGLLRDHGLHVAQLLVTHEDLAQAERAQRFRATIMRLLEFPAVVPIINENDSVAIEELRFGDNDKLSAQVALLWGADQLLLLTSAPGLLRDLNRPEEGPIEVVEDVAAVLHHAQEKKTELGSGGMISKLKAVEEAVSGGVQCIIASGRRAELLPAIVSGQGKGCCTRFLARS